jgi:MoxR-vWA-beta-propeller ternary system domain bpX5
MHAHVQFHPRAVALVPAGVVATGACALALGHRLLELSTDHLHALQGVATVDTIVVLGDAANLPWALGVVYLGREDAAPRLLLPTLDGPSVPADLFERAVLKHMQTESAVAVVLAPELRLISLAAARPLDARVLGAWLEARA